MKERFGLSEESRFTMLSGIAHDPIQRDSKSFLCPSVYPDAVDDLREY